MNALWWSALWHLRVGGALEESQEPFMFILCPVLITATNMLIVMIIKNKAFELAMDSPWIDKHHQLYDNKVCRGQFTWTVCLLSCLHRRTWTKQVTGWTV